MEKRVAPVKDLFLVLFFVSVGSLIDPFPSFAIGIPIIAVLVLVVSGKFAGGYLVGRIFTKNGNNSSREARMPSARAFGSRLVPRGEFSLLIAQLGLTLGLVDQTFFSLVGMTVIVTAISSSILQRFTEPKMASTVYPFKGKSDGQQSHS